MKRKVDDNDQHAMMMTDVAPDRSNWRQMVLVLLDYEVVVLDFEQNIVKQEMVVEVNPDKKNCFYDSTPRQYIPFFYRSGIH